MVYLPSVPDNVSHWQVFNNDKQIEKFMTYVGCFVDSYFEGSSKILSEDHLDPSNEQEIVQLKGNKIPHGIVSLENIFSQKSEGFIPKKGPNLEVNREYDKINVKSSDDQKWISIGKTYSLKERDKLKSLLTNFKNVFTWSYDDLKIFKKREYRHSIPLIPEVFPFRKKLRNYNPKESKVF